MKEREEQRGKVKQSLFPVSLFGIYIGVLFLMSGTATIAAVICYCELESVAVPESPLCCAVSAGAKVEFGKSTLKIVPPPAFSEMTILPR